MNRKNAKIPFYFLEFSFKINEETLKTNGEAEENPIVKN